MPGRSRMQRAGRMPIDALPGYSRRTLSVGPYFTSDRSAFPVEERFMVIQDGLKIDGRPQYGEYDLPTGDPRDGD